VKRNFNLVRRRLLAFSSSDFVNSELYGPSIHMLRRHGKLLRPTLVLLGAHFLKEDPKEYVDLAIAAELIHTSSLVHDDVIDNDDKRNGVATVHRKYGIETAVLVGDALISKAISMSAKYGDDVMSAMAKSTMEMCAGELLDYNFQKTGKVPSVEECLNIDMLKSASLIAACCNIVAVHKKDRSSDKMYLFGKDLGMAFQIKDDIIDYMKWAKDGGKGVLVPNIVSSIDAENKKGQRTALIEAKELNQKYVRKASQRLGKGSEAKLLKEYANLIMVKI
jgi:geranylgeranyl pyrophosphate synthase